MKYLSSETLTETLCDMDLFDNVPNKLSQESEQKLLWLEKGLSLSPVS